MFALKNSFLLMLVLLSLNGWAKGLKSGDVLEFSPAADFRLNSLGLTHVVSALKIDEELVIRIYGSCFDTFSWPTTTNITPLSTIKLSIGLNLDSGTETVDVIIPASGVIDGRFWRGYFQQKGAGGEPFSTVLNRAQGSLIKLCKKRTDLEWCRMVTSGQVMKNSTGKKSYQVVAISNIKNIKTEGVGAVVQLTIPNRRALKNSGNPNFQVVSSVYAFQVAVPTGRFVGTTGPLEIDYDLAVSNDGREIEIFVAYPGHSAFCSSFL